MTNVTIRKKGELYIYIQYTKKEKRNSKLHKYKEEEEEIS